MELKTTFEHYYPDGCIGGQCGEFAEKLVHIGMVGDSLHEKTETVNRVGIPLAKLNGDFRIGDVVITNESLIYGHVCVINDITPAGYQLTESNYGLDYKVHHTRILPLQHVIGVIRGDIIPKLIYKQMNVKIKLLGQSQRQYTQAVINEVVDTANKWSSGHLNLIFDYSQIAPQTIPYNFYEHAVDPMAGGASYDITCIDRDWMKQNVATQGAGNNIAIILVDEVNWRGSIQGLAYTDCGANPAMIAIDYIPDNLQESYKAGTGLYDLSKLILHELMHSLYMIAQQQDKTHYFDYQMNNLALAYQDLQYDWLAQRLSQIVPIEYRKYNEQFKQLNTDGSITVVTDNEILDRLYSGKIKYKIYN